MHKRFRTLASVLAISTLLTGSAAQAQPWGFHHHYWNPWGGVVAAGAAGLAAGALIGEALVPPYYGSPVYGPHYAANDDVGYCESRYRSYDPASGTFLGYDGLRHPCP